MQDTTVTIKDIAKSLGVSVSTVSRALKDSPSISEERRKLIQAYAREHRYQPNMLASTLRSQRHARPNLIGVVVPQFIHYFSLLYSQELKRLVPDMVIESWWLKVMILTCGKKKSLKPLDLHK